MAFREHSEEAQIRRAAEREGAPLAANRNELVWLVLRREAARDAATEPLLSSFLHACILSHDSFEQSLAFVLSKRLASPCFLATELFEVFLNLLGSCPQVVDASLEDIRAHYQRVRALRVVGVVGGVDVHRWVGGWVRGWGPSALLCAAPALLSHWPAASPAPPLHCCRTRPARPTATPCSTSRGTTPCRCACDEAVAVRCSRAVQQYTRCCGSSTALPATLPNHTHHHHHAAPRRDTASHMSCGAAASAPLPSRCRAA